MEETDNNTNTNPKAKAQEPLEMRKKVMLDAIFQTVALNIAGITEGSRE